MGAKIASDGQWRFPATSHIPHKFKTALTHFEDKRFRWHPGVDPIAIVRSAYLNFSKRKIVSGASTISMQVIRLVRKNPDRSYLEKLIEMMLAMRLELSHSKNEILALYSNNAPFGGNVVGLEAASWRYFGRSPDRLSWAESCMIAVLPNSPSLIHPGKNRALLKSKRDRLLMSLHKAGVIDKIETKLAMLEPLPKKPLALPRYAPHLLDTLLTKNKNKGKRFNTTIDHNIQIFTQKILDQRSLALSKQGIRHAAALVIDNNTFEVIAYVGNSRIAPMSNNGYAIDLIKRPRSTGSILKPLLYAIMIQSGDILPITLVPDLPTQIAGYIPKNYDKKYRGAVPAQTALSRSLNVPAVRMLKEFGISRFYDYLEKIGMTTLNRPPDNYGLTLILGGAEGTLWDITTIYANVANIAQRKNYQSDKTYRLPKVLKTDSITTEKISELNPGAAWLTMKALLEVARPGTEGHWKKFSSSRRISWKTGTSYGFRDAWAIGSNARYTVGIWVGNADGEGRPDLTGISSAAPILFDIFNRLGSSSWFRKPQQYLKTVEVCKENGYLVKNRCSTIKQLVPVNSYFEAVSPNHHIVHLDKTGIWRVHGRCEQVSNMLHKSWFILPPGQEYYYRKHHPEYRSLPRYRVDCRKWVARTGKKGPITFLYPNIGSKVYIPMDLAEKKGRTVFEVVHRDRDIILYWHLNNRYLGHTKTFHQQAIYIAPGHHVITVVDQYGNQLSRKFEVLDKNDS